MTTVQINLPDALAEDAQNAGLLTPEAIEKLLREQLKKQAGEALREMWEHMPQEELTPEIEKMIDDEVKAVRAKRRRCCSYSMPLSNAASSSARYKPQPVDDVL